MVIPALERVKTDQNRHNLSLHIFFVRVLPLGKKKNESQPANVSASPELMV